MGAAPITCWDLALRYNHAILCNWLRNGMSARLRLWVFFVLVTFVTSASAYVDPGSALLMIQGLLAVLGGIVVFVKNPIKAIKRLIARFKDRNRA